MHHYFAYANEFVLCETKSFFKSRNNHILLISYHILRFIRYIIYAASPSNLHVQKYLYRIIALLYYTTGERTSYHACLLVQLLLQ